MTDTREPEASSTPTRGPERALSWNSFFSTYLPAFILAAGTGIAVPAVAPLARSYGVSFGVASLVVTAFLIGGVIGTIPAGWLVDRYGRRSIMIAGPVLAAVSGVLVVFAQSFPELVIYRLLGGMAAQMWMIARLSAISKNTPANQRGKQVSWLFGMDHSGKVTGPLLGGFVAGAWGLKAPFLLYAVMALVALVPAFLATREEGKELKAERKAKANGKSAASKWTARRIVMSFLPVFAIALFAGLTRGPVQADLLHLYAAFEYNLGPEGIGLLATAAAAIGLPIGFLAGWIMDRYGRRRTMIPGFAAVAVGMSALSVTAFADSPFVVYVAMFLFATAAQALTGGSVQTVGADVAPAEARGRFLGLYRFTGQGGSAASPLIFAFISSHVDYGPAFLFPALTAVVVVILVWRYVEE